ncbi:hypothetical protein [Rhizobium arsenicireducens]
MAYKTGEPSWTWRRLLVAVVISVSFSLIVGIKDAADTMINRTIVEGAFFLVMAFGLSYLGIPAAQDMIAIWRTKSGLPYKEEEE